MLVIVMLGAVAAVFAKLLTIWSYLGLFYTMRDLTTRTVYVILDWVVFSFLIDY